MIHFYFVQLVQKLSWSLSWYKTIFKSFWSNEKYVFRMSVSILRTFFRLAFKSSTPPRGLSGTPHCSCLVSIYFLMSSIILVWYLLKHLTISLCCKKAPYHAGYHVSKIAFRAKAFLLPKRMNECQKFCDSYLLEVLLIL